MGTFYKAAEALLATAVSLFAGTGLFARRGTDQDPALAITYWVARYREIDGRMLSTTIRIISADVKHRRIHVWCHAAHNGHGHERALDIDRFVEVIDLRTGSKIDARQWLASQSETLRGVRRIRW